MSKPRTEAGRALAARAKRESWSNWEGLAQFTIPAIEREAATPPVAPPALDEAASLLHRLVDHEDQPCQFDHHGNCREHNLENPCTIREARDFLARLTAEEPER